MSGKVAKKRKIRSIRQSISLGEKLEIIRLIEREGRHQIDVAKEKGLPQSTVQQIYSQRVKITQSFSQFGLASKRSKPSTFPEIDDALTKWFDAARAQNLSLNGPVVLEKAKKIAEDLGCVTFKGKHSFKR